MNFVTYRDPPLKGVFNIIRQSMDTVLMVALRDIFARYE